MDAKNACKIEAFAYAIAATLAQMEKDGKLSTAAQQQEHQERTDPASKGSADSSRTLVLRQLYEAEVISEEEYRREMEALKAKGK